MRKVALASRLVTLAMALLFLLTMLGWDAVRAGQAKSGWRAEWEKTVAAARKEGQVVSYASDSYDGVFREFQRKYPKIKVVGVLGRGSQLASRIMAERRAGKYLADFYLGGSGTAYNVFYKGKILDPIEPTLFHPEVLDKSKWWGGKHFYHDDESKHILSFNGIAQTYFSYSTKLVHPGEIKSYWDFLNPKWKGRIVVMDPLKGGGVSGVLQFLYRNAKLGPKFLRRFLSEMDLTATRDTRLLVDWLAVGKFAISGLQSPDRSGIYEAKKQGLPVGWFDPKGFKEGGPLSTSSGNMALLNKAPHPNAARVFINWFLSREGQMIYQKVDPEKDSLRIDIPKDDVRPNVRRVKGVTYLILVGPGFKDMRPVRKVVREAWRKKR